MAINRIKTGGITDNTIQSGDLAPGTVANDRLANTSITINGTSIALGASGEIVAGTDWQAVTVADGSTQLNAVAGKGYFLDTSSGVIDVKLPTSPTRGDTIVLADYGNNFATNRVVVDTGGKLIDSVVGGSPGSGGFAIETNGAIVELVFADDTAGWIIKQNNAPSDLGAESYDKYVTATGGTVTESGDYKIHTFTGDGCFVVSCAGNPGGSNAVDYLVVAGGGGGGAGGPTGFGRGGGGAGGYRESHSTPVSGCYTASPLATPTGITVSATTYPVTVGGGGSSGPDSPSITDGTSGSNSVFSTITSAGGGGGAGNTSGTSAGGSGGGESDSPYPSFSATNGAAGNTPPVSPPQGNPGGANNCGPRDLTAAGGGGGGATAAGANGGATPPHKGGSGGAGATTSITGSPTAYSGGGAGGGNAGPALGGSGVGGNGGGANTPTGFAGTAGTTNTGGGGGGGGYYCAGGTSNSSGGNGGKGIVIIRYKFQ